jgi:hypothetical protein
MPDMNEEPTHTERPTLNPVSGFPNYVITEDDFIYSLKAKRKMARRWTSSGWTSRLTGPDGTVVTVRHKEALERPLPSLTESISVLGIREIPYFPRYYVGETGTVYKSYKGDRIGRVAEQTRGVQSYVNLVGADGVRRIKNVSTLVSLAFGRPLSRAYLDRNS